MMDFIMVPLIMGIITAGIYGVFELFARRKERMAIIEKIGDKLDAAAFDGKLGLPSYVRNFSFSALKIGSLMAGIGLGLLVGYFINYSMGNLFNNDWGNKQVAGLVYGATVLLFGGISLLIAFIIELKIAKKK